MAGTEVGVVLAYPDQSRRQCSEHVGEGDPLGHRRHRNPHAQWVADEGTNDQPNDDPAVADDLGLDQRADDGDQHPDRRQHHPPAGLFRLGQAAKAENE